MTVIFAVDNYHAPDVRDQQTNWGREVYVMDYVADVLFLPLAPHPDKLPAITGPKRDLRAWEWGMTYASIPLAAAILFECMNTEFRRARSLELAPKFAKEVLSALPVEGWELSAVCVKAWVLDQQTLEASKR